MSGLNLIEYIWRFLNWRAGAFEKLPGPASSPDRRFPPVSRKNTSFCFLLFSSSRLMSSSLLFSSLLIASLPSPSSPRLVSSLSLLFFAPLCFSLLFSTLPFLFSALLLFDFYLSFFLKPFFLLLWKQFVVREMSRERLVGVELLWHLLGTSQNDAVGTQVETPITYYCSFSLSYFLIR